MIHQYDAVPKPRFGAHIVPVDIEDINLTQTLTVTLTLTVTVTLTLTLALTLTLTLTLTPRHRGHHRGKLPQRMDLRKHRRVGQ